MRKGEKRDDTLVRVLAWKRTMQAWIPGQPFTTGRPCVLQRFLGEMERIAEERSQGR